MKFYVLRLVDWLPNAVNIIYYYRKDNPKCVIGKNTLLCTFSPE
jgi:hypothetical protein